MGQQQLLLLVLGVVIVGLAVVAGIGSFNDARSKSEIDRYTGMGVEMAGEIIAWYHKPTTQGGGGDDASNLVNLTIDDLGYPIEASESTTYAGATFTGTVNNRTMRYVGANATHPFLHIHQMPRAPGMNRVEVHVFGPSPECIVARNAPFNTGANWSDGKAETEAPDNPNPAACSWTPQRTVRRIRGAVM